MHRNRFNFTQPYWEFVLPLLSWLFLLPIAVWSTPASGFKVVDTGLIQMASSLVSTRIGLYAIASLSIMLLAWSIGNTITTQELLRKRNYLPAGLAAFFGSLVVLTFGFSFSYLAVFFFLQGIGSLLNVKRESKSYNFIFNSGFLVAMGALIDVRLWLTFPFLILGLLSLRKLSLRDILIMLAGVLNVLFMAGGLYYLVMDSLPDTIVFSSFSHVEFKKVNKEFIYLLASTLGVVTILGVAFFENYISVLSNKVKIRFRILMYFSVLIFVIFNLWNIYYSESLDFSFFVISLALAATICATYVKNRWLRLLTVLCFVTFFILWCWFFFS